MKRLNPYARVLACACALLLAWTSFAARSPRVLLKSVKAAPAVTESAPHSPAESGISPQTNQSGANAGAAVVVPDSPSFLLNPQGKTLPFGQHITLPLAKLDIKSGKVLVRRLGTPASAEQADLLNQGADERIFPASMTKLMTALLILEALSDGHVKPDQKESVRWSDLEGLYEQDASVIGLEFAEEMSVKDLLYGTLLASGNDAAQTLTHALSEHVFAYIDLMNKKAKALGLKATNFANVTGLSHPKNYSSLNDIAVILQECLKYPLFKEICSLKSYTSAPSEEHPEGIAIHNTLYSYMDELGESIHYIQGGKSGFIEESRYSLASFHIEGGQSYLIVSSAAEEAGQNVLDHEKIYRYLFEPAGPYKLLNQGDLLRTLPVTGAETQQNVKLTVAKDFLLKVAPAAFLEDFKVTLSLPDRLKAPLAATDAVGVLAVSQKIEGEEKEVYRQLLTPGVEIKQSGTAYIMEFAPVYLGYAFAVLFLLLLIFLVIRSFRKKAPEGAKKAQQHFEDFES